jgi:hypothetical protein
MKNKSKSKDRVDARKRRSSSRDKFEFYTVHLIPVVNRNEQVMASIYSIKSFAWLFSNLHSNTVACI